MEAEISVSELETRSYPRLPPVLVGIEDLPTVPNPAVGRTAVPLADVAEARANARDSASHCIVARVDRAALLPPAPPRTSRRRTRPMKSSRLGRARPLAPPTPVALAIMFGWILAHAMLASAVVLLALPR